MTSYETEHASDPPTTSNSTPRPPRRPDMSSLHTLIREIAPQTTSSTPRSREHAVPVPGDISAAFRHLAEALQTMSHSDAYQGNFDSAVANNDLLQAMISQLLSTAEHPPKEVQGVDEEYIAQLERIPVKKLKLKKGDTGMDDCPICGNAFLDDSHPLVVRLPCHDTHVFDLECIRPWLLLNGTCPLDRVDLGKREREKKDKIRQSIKGRGTKKDEEEEEWDGLYG